jgi:hypothetical protein
MKFFTFDRVFVIAILIVFSLVAKMAYDGITTIERETNARIGKILGPCRATCKPYLAILRESDDGRTYCMCDMTKKVVEALPQ